jgi:diaminopimelate decarboxylase
MLEAAATGRPSSGLLELPGGRQEFVGGHQETVKVLEYLGTHAHRQGMTLLDAVHSLRRAAPQRIDPAVWPVTAQVDVEGRLCVGGVALTEIADQFGAPVVVLDEAEFRYRMRGFRVRLPQRRTVYAGHALLTKAVARWVAEEGVGLAVRTPAELALGVSAGMDRGRVVAHGCAQTTADLRAAAGVGRMVLGCGTEIALLASQLSRPQQVLIASPELAGRVLAQPMLRLVGLRCAADEIKQAVSTMADIRERHGVTMAELNIGDVPVDADLVDLDEAIDDALDDACAAERFPRPVVVVEPGRAIAARAAVSCARVMAVREGLVTADGAATGTVALASRHPLGPGRPVTVVGRTGAVICAQVVLPADLHPGDLLAVVGPVAAGAALTARPPVVTVRDRRATLSVRRETTEDLLSRELD